MDILTQIPAASNKKKKEKPPMLNPDWFVDLNRLFRELLAEKTNEYIRALRLFQIDMAVRFCIQRDGRTPASLKKMGFPVYIKHDAYQNLCAMACARLLHRVTRFKFDIGAPHERKRKAFRQMMRSEHFLALYPEFMFFNGWSSVSDPTCVEEYYRAAKERFDDMKIVGALLDISLRFQPDKSWGRKTGSLNTAFDLLNERDTRYRLRKGLQESESTLRRRWRDFEDVSIFCFLYHYSPATPGLQHSWGPDFVTNLVAAAQDAKKICQFIDLYNWVQAQLTTRGYRMRRIEANIGESEARIELKLDKLQVDDFEQVETENKLV